MVALPGHWPTHGMFMLAKQCTLKHSHTVHKHEHTHTLGSLGAVGTESASDNTCCSVMVGQSIKTIATTATAWHKHQSPHTWHASVMARLVKSHTHETGTFPPR